MYTIIILTIKKESSMTKKGFTIIELMLVIVVIAILAAIALVSYNGAQLRAIKTTVQNDLNNGISSLKLNKMFGTAGYPGDLSSLNNGKGFKLSGDNQYVYATAIYNIGNNRSYPSYCLIIYNAKYNIVSWIDTDGVRHELKDPAYGQEVCVVKFYWNSGSSIAGSQSYVVTGVNPLTIGAGGGGMN